MKSIKLIFLALVLTCTTSIVNAQETAKTPEVKAANQTEHLTSELTLTASQQEQVYAINLGIIQKNDAIRDNVSMNSELKTESMKQNNEARKQLIKEVLTPEQIVKFETMEKNQQIRQKQINKTIEKPALKN